jgi:hypothetical protein
MGRVEPKPIELILYVTAQSPQVDAAVAKMRGVLERRFNSPRVTVKVCPLPDSGSGAVTEPAGDGAAWVRSKIAARTLIVGHITHPEILLELLTDCDIDS